MLKIIVIAAVAPLAVFAAQAAKAQEFNGDCKVHAASREACVATKWCQFVQRKPITLPDGKTYTPAGYCAFKAGHKQAWQAAQQPAPNN